MQVSVRQNLSEHPNLSLTQDGTSAGNPRLSVIIPTFNAAGEVARCLAAIAAEGLADPAAGEVIVVDDGSTDGTADLVAARFPWVRLIRLERNVGADAARNAAVALARAPVLAFVDSDCEVLPGWRAAVLAAVRPGERPVSMGRVVTPAGFLLRTLAVLEQGEFIGGREGPIANFATLNLALEARVLRERPFDGALRTCGDRALSWELHRSGLPMRFDPSHAVLHVPRVTLGGLLGRRRRYVDAFLRVRRRDPSLPGARLLALGPLAAPLVFGGRVARDLGRLWRARRELGISLPGLVPHGLAVAGLRFVEAALLFERLLDAPFRPWYDER